MEKEVGQVRVVETDDGLRVEIKGEKFKEMFSCCWLPMCCCNSKNTDCCPPGDKK